MRSSDPNFSHPCSKRTSHSNRITLGLCREDLLRPSNLQQYQPTGLAATQTPIYHLSPIEHLWDQLEGLVRRRQPPVRFSGPAKSSSLGRIVQHTNEEDELTHELRA